MNTLARVLDKLIRLGSDVSASLILVTALIILYEVIVRKFGNPTTWAFYTSQYLQVYIIWLGVAWVLAEGGHVNVDLLVNKLRGRPLKFASIISASIVVFVSLVLLVGAIQLMTFSISNDVKEVGWTYLPAWLIQWPLAAGCFLLVISAIRRWIKVSRKVTIDRIDNSVEIKTTPNSL